jgi:hypothetical protein
MNVTKEELGKAFQLVAEQMHLIDESLAKIAVELTALKGLLAIQLNPESPEKGLARIEALRAEIEKRDPSAGSRKQLAEASWRF